ncbi:hypothetical protein J4E89_001924 [Alternaria sp. Ai002NY15]|nr:hypothetical protein J4E89_001924 [Alternaria sp. Ai002NY15]
MRGFLVKLAGFALYVHNLQSGRLTLLHERPNREPTVYTLNEEDFEENADELDDEIVATMEPGIEASAVGLSLRLMKNDGVLKATFESEHHGVADWIFHGLRGSNGGRMNACAFTQTASETSAGCKCTEIVPPELSNSTIQTVSTHPIPDRIAQPLPSGLSMISTTETRPLKRKATEDMDQPIPHKRAKSTPKSPPWPNHLYMTCFRTHPISKSDIGTLHIDLIVGSVWFEGWYGKANARTYEKKQIYICNPSNVTPTVIVDAIVHCIDRATQRQPIHDPETEHKLDQDHDLLTIDLASEEQSEEADKRYLAEDKKYQEWVDRSNQHRTVHDLEKSRYRRTKGGSAK